MTPVDTIRPILCRLLHHGFVRVKRTVVQDCGDGGMVVALVVLVAQCQ